MCLKGALFSKKLRHLHKHQNRLGCETTFSWFHISLLTSCLRCWTWAQFLDEQKGQSLYLCFTRKSSMHLGQLSVLLGKHLSQPFLAYCKLVWKSAILFLPRVPTSTFCKKDEHKGKKAGNSHKKLRAEHGKCRMNSYSFFLKANSGFARGPGMPLGCPAFLIFLFQPLWRARVHF